MYLVVPNFKKIYGLGKKKPHTFFIYFQQFEYRLVCYLNPHCIQIPTIPYLLYNYILSHGFLVAATKTK